MIKAIVYQSKTGFTKKYAELLSEATGLPVYELKKLKKELSRRDNIIFMGWVCAGKIKGVSRAARHFVLSAVCAVGLTSPELLDINKMAKKNNVRAYKLFYLQGGFAPEKQKGLNALLINMVKKSEDNDAGQTDADKEFRTRLENGYDAVSLDNLNKVIAYIKEKKPVKNI